MSKYSNKSLEMKVDAPVISVMMPVYNGERFLSKAIRSILRQSFEDFEFIIINDGSTDKTEEIIRSFNDPRIVYKKNGANLGLAQSFNVGIDAARGEYLARMDADDISLPNRLEKQLGFLEREPQIGIVGSSILIIDESDKEIAFHSRPEDHTNIKFSSLFSSPMYHPTVMGRMEIFKKHRYNETFSNSEDYDLWNRLLFEAGIHFANIAEPLILYRVYPQSFTQALNLDRRALSAHNTIRNVSHYITLSKRDKDFIIHLRQERFLPPGEFLRGLFIYFRAARAFTAKEHLHLSQFPSIYRRYLGFSISLIKYNLKKVLHRLRLI